MIYENMTYDEDQFPVKVLFQEQTQQAVFVAHWHEAIEITLVRDGELTVTNNSRSFAVLPGQLTCAHSNHLHYYQSKTPVCRYYTLIFDPKMLGNPAFAEQALPLCVVAQQETSFFLQMQQLLEERPAFYQEEVLGLLRQVFARLVRLGGGETAGQDRQLNTHIKLAIRYIREHYKQNLTLEAVASTVGISPYYLSHIFKKVTGMTVTEYWQSVRCNQARELLHGGSSVEQAAEQSGFSSLSHFRKVYAALFGVLPGKDKQ